MNKLCIIVLFAIIAVTWCFPHEQQEKRTSACLPGLAQMLAADGVDMGDSQMWGDCATHNKRFLRDAYNNIRRKSYQNYDRFARGMACCSPDCDWILSYLEVDSSVVKCLKK